MFRRVLAEVLSRSKKSVLLLGPRQTGKSTLASVLRPDLTINLAHEPTYLEFLRAAAELEARIAATKPRLVLIDEVQRIPSLLNTIQTILDRGGRAPKFILTGSSARKLRRGHANLLPGRVHTYRLGPLVSAEIGGGLNTNRALETGTLPGVYSESDRADRQKTLRSYAVSYLKEEVQAEALTRNLEGFARFMDWAATTSGQYLDLSKLSAQAAVPRQTAVRFFEILQDTLIVNLCEPFTRSARRRLVQHPRYFFFDNGVLNGLLGSFDLSLERMGWLFEHLIFNQIIHSASAFDRDVRISSYRTSQGAEVDFIVELPGRETWAVEVKASRSVARTDLRGLKSFADFYGKRHRPCIAYLGSEPKRIDDVDILPWETLLNEMGFGE